MKATELRVGNLVKAKHTNGNPNKWVVIKVKPEHIVTCSDKPKWFKPIPLTEKILEKCCEANTVGTFRYKSRLIVKREQEWFDYGSNVKLDYLHQFQNFIFATTKKELKIEL